jgi:hypothetical protein
MNLANNRQCCSNALGINQGLPDARPQIRLFAVRLSAWALAVAILRQKVHVAEDVESLFGPRHGHTDTVGGLEKIVTLYLFGFRILKPEAIAGGENCQIPVVFSNFFKSKFLKWRTYVQKADPILWVVGAHK